MPDHDEHPKERSTDWFLQQLLAVDESDVPVLDRGAEVGRYVVIERLGAGGMGMVYRAFDPTLDRSVALKLMKVAPNATDSAAASERLLREAQALAKLSHPNVIAVHDVGVVGDDVFVAMEYVPGSTLTDWCAQRDRTVDEIVEAFAAAGQGLAAAHAVGLIHRDFKPDNVIVGADGRVRVLDFGLAQAASQAKTGVTESAAGGETRRHVTGKTSAGVIGTPAYMAPEQHTAGAVDERSDQFSFCAALYEALYGGLPFAGTTVAELEREVVAGNIVDAPADTAVPGWLRDVVVRGLSVDPDARWPSIEVLAGQLVRARKSPARTAVIIAAVAVAAIVIGGLGVWFGRRGAAADPCGDAGEPMARVWSDAVKTDIREAFRATGRPEADAVYERLRIVLGGYAATWVSMSTQLCRVGPGDSDTERNLRQLQLTCLDRRLTEMSELVTKFTGDVDDKKVVNAVHDAFDLLGVGTCADTEGLLAAVPEPSAGPPPEGCGVPLAGRFNPIDIGRVWVYDVIRKATRIPAGDPKVLTVEALTRIGGCKGDKRAYRIRRQMGSGYAFRWQEAQVVDSPEGFPPGEISVRHRDQWFTNDGVPTKDEYYVPSRIRIGESCATTLEGATYLDTYDEVEVEVSPDPDLCTAEVQRKTRTFDWKVVSVHEEVELTLDYSHPACCSDPKAGACRPPADGPGHRCTFRSESLWDCRFDAIQVQRREVRGGKLAEYWFALGVGKVKEDTKGDVVEDLVCFTVPYAGDDSSD